MKEIITVEKDLDKLSDRADEIDIKTENALMREIILELKEIIRDKNLTSLSAPQIGYNKRIFCINFKGDIRTFINPVTIEVKGLTLSKETCSSIPDKTYIRPRNTEISIIYQTPLGKTETVKMVGKAAEVVQHEIDHLDGLLLSDIGLEIDDDFDKLTDEEKEELLKTYMDSLDIKQKEVHKEIDENPELKKIDDGIKFMEAVATNKVQLEVTPVTDEQNQQIKDKLEKLNKETESK